jgi:hypothetical protein
MCTTPFLDPEDNIADWIADKVWELVPNPCEKAAELAENLEDAKALVAAPVGTLAEYAQSLVPEAVDRALGLISPTGDLADDTNARPRQRRSIT